MDLGSLGHWAFWCHSPPPFLSCCFPLFLRQGSNYLSPESLRFLLPLWPPPFSLQCGHIFPVHLSGSTSSRPGSRKKNSCWQLVPVFRSLAWGDTGVVGQAQDTCLSQGLNMASYRWRSGHRSSWLSSTWSNTKAAISRKGSAKESKEVLRWLKGTQHRVRKQTWHEFTWQFSDLTHKRQLKNTAK